MTPTSISPIGLAHDGQGQARAGPKAETRRFGLTRSRRVERAGTRRRGPRGDRGRAQRLVAAGQRATARPRRLRHRPMTSTTSKTTAKGRSGLDWFRFEVNGRQADPRLLPARSARSRRLGQSAGSTRSTPRPAGPSPICRARTRWRSSTTASASGTPSTSAARSPAGPITSRSTPTIPTTSCGPASCPCRLTTSRRRRSRPGCTTS